MVQNYCSYQKSGLQACLEVQTTNNRTKQNSTKTNKTEKTKAVHEQYKYCGSTVVSEILDILHAESHIILHPLSLFCQNSKFKNLLPSLPNNKVAESQCVVVHYVRYAISPCKNYKLPSRNSFPPLMTNLRVPQW